jgi:hypothetical protein
VAHIPINGKFHFAGSAPSATGGYEAMNAKWLTRPAENR